jgi:hypothetical protein
MLRAALIGDCLGITNGLREMYMKQQGIAYAKTISG